MGLSLNKLNNCIFFLSLVFLSGCGGGGGSSSEDITLPIITPPPPTNTTPVCTNSSYPKTLYCRVKRQNLDREFFVYIPDGIDDSTPVPLLFGLHGYTSRAVWFLGYSDFQPIADEEKFIIIYPQGSILQSTGQTHWNVGGWTTSSSTDDVDFISSLIDWSAENYNINLKRVYSTGMSNGGYMSYRLACDLSSKTAAIASVTGSMTPETFNTCSPNHPTAVLQIHGDVDGVVPYYGDWKGRSIPDVMNYWKEYNDCQIEDISNVPDVNEDGDGGFFFLYDQCLADIQSELYLMTNMGHEWPRFSNGNDINAAQVIWQFFSQYDIDGRINE